MKKLLRIILVYLLAFNTMVIFSASSASASLPACSDDEKLPVLVPQDPPQQCADIIGLQQGLKKLGYYTGPLNGKYDQQTVRAVRHFQRSHHLPVTGLVGVKTWAALVKTYDLAAGPDAVIPKPTGEVSVLIDTRKLTLTVEVDRQPYKTFPVAVGKQSTPTPIGEWKIVDKGAKWGSGFGTRWLGLNVPWGIYGIHGTNKPWSIGRRASHGCIRMRNHDVEQLYQWVSVGTRVRIIGHLPSVQLGRELKRGQIGQDIVALQLALRQAGVFAGYADGRFGQETEMAVRRLESIHFLPVDGQVDPQVRQILFEYVKAEKPASETSSS
ncbi:MAG: L,D-transpeptidase family protein [Firmicutes bacterium]|nr:L,D-transpeptidase family protein [Bacillota bacterium]